MIMLIYDSFIYDSFTPTQKSLNQVLIFMNLDHHAKNQAILSILLKHIVDLTRAGE